MPSITSDFKKETLTVSKGPISAIRNLDGIIKNIENDDMEFKKEKADLKN
jgi:hypothetical protein